MKKLLILLLFAVHAFATDYAVMPISSDLVFNYFFSIFAWWTLLLSGLYAALSLFRL